MFFVVETTYPDLSHRFWYGCCINIQLFCHCKAHLVDSKGNKANVMTL
jgi:hypothetical protein